ncbi:MAG: hypothetical protein M5U09_05785 [Gammaproteobacteria bacterium]|nr:hypothetical protein [Gammaproteobacteria bacterium]
MGEPWPAKPVIVGPPAMASRSIERALSAMLLPGWAVTSSK